MLCFEWAVYLQELVDKALRCFWYPMCVGILPGSDSHSNGSTPPTRGRQNTSQRMTCRPLRFLIFKIFDFCEAQKCIAK